MKFREWNISQAICQAIAITGSQWRQGGIGDWLNLIREHVPDVEHSEIVQLIKIMHSARQLGVSKPDDTRLHAWVYTGWESDKFFWTGSFNLGIL